MDTPGWESRKHQKSNNMCYVDLITCRKAPAPPASRCPPHFILSPSFGCTPLSRSVLSPQCEQASSLLASPQAALEPLHPCKLPGVLAGGPADLLLRELEHLHSLVHQGLIVALPQQPLTGTEVAEKLRQRGHGGKIVRGVAGTC